MDQFSPFELTELFFSRESVIDTQFQYWITFTFAVIVASFVAGNRLNRRLRVVVASLYAIATIVVVSRWYYVGQDLVAFIAQLREHGVAIGIPWITIASRVVLVALGSSAAIVFLLSEKLRGEPDN